MLMPSIGKKAHHISSGFYFQYLLLIFDGQTQLNM